MKSYVAPRPFNEQPLLMKDYGIAYAHLTLPVGWYASEAEAIREALEAEEEIAGQIRKKLQPEPLETKISYLTGQSDVMLEMKVRDFRSAVHLQYPSGSMGANWLFLVPYDVTLPPADQEKLALNFVVHIRLNRAVYRAVKGEDNLRLRGAVVERQVVEFIREHAVANHLSGEVMAGFGWSDLAFGGTFLDPDDLRNFVRKIESDAIGGLSIARRVLTLVGYNGKDLESKKTDAYIQPLLFVRALPTHIHQAAHTLDSALSQTGMDWSIQSIDGKWDLVIGAKQTMPLQKYLEMHLNTAIAGGVLSNAGVERLESHLLATPVEPEPADRLTFKDCDCREIFDEEPPIVTDDDRKNLRPRALTRAIENVNDLFRAASRDTTNCCDVVPSLRKVTAAGRRLIASYRRLEREIKDLSDGGTAPDSIIQWSAVLDRARHDLEDWCTYAERSVSQRTVGRFEEFLAQNERVVSYRGGIQKMLYIADCLTNAYARPILRAPEDSSFVTLYDPVDTVVNMRKAGFIRVPVRYLFFLPLAITHLWHEVGMYVFFSDYSIPYDERSASRIGEFLEMTAAVRPPDPPRVYVEVAEMYGDFITLHYGFRENVEDFSLALSTAMIEQVGYLGATRVGKEAYLQYLLTRLYLVTEFKMRRLLIAARLARSPLTSSRADIDAWRPSTEAVSKKIRSIAEMLNREVFFQSRYNGEGEPAITEGLIRRAVENIHAGIDAAHRKYMNDLAWKLPPVRPESLEEAEIFEAISEGKVVTMPDDIDPNSIYQRLQRSMIRKLRTMPRGTSSAEATFLQSTAALMRTVLLWFYEKEPERRRSTPPGQNLIGILRHARPISGPLPDLDLDFSRQ